MPVHKANPLILRGANSPILVNFDVKNFDSACKQRSWTIMLILKMRFDVIVVRVNANFLIRLIAIHPGTSYLFTRRRTGLGTKQIASHLRFYVIF